MGEQDDEAPWVDWVMMDSLCEQREPRARPRGEWTPSRVVTDQPSADSRSNRLPHVSEGRCGPGDGDAVSGSVISSERGAPRRIASGGRPASSLGAGCHGAEQTFANAKARMNFSESTLHRLDALPLECDGLTRVMSTLLLRDGIDHRVMHGQLHIDTVGTVGIHWWITIADGRHLDFRARMWLGESVSVPHGAFVPSATQRYTPSSDLSPWAIALSPAVFEAMTGEQLALFPSIQS